MIKLTKKQSEFNKHPHNVMRTSTSKLTRSLEYTQPHFLKHLADEEYKTTQLRLIDPKKPKSLHYEATVTIP